MKLDTVFTIMCNFDRSGFIFTNLIFLWNHRTSQLAFQLSQFWLLSHMMFLYAPPPAKTVQLQYIKQYRLTTNGKHSIWCKCYLPCDVTVMKSSSVKWLWHTTLCGPEFIAKFSTISFDRQNPKFLCFLSFGKFKPPRLNNQEHNRKSAWLITSITFILSTFTYNRKYVLDSISFTEGAPIFSAFTSVVGSITRIL
jgi:hypothetical protein